MNAAMMSMEAFHALGRGPGRTLWGQSNPSPHTPGALGLCMIYVSNVEDCVVIPDLAEARRPALTIRSDVSSPFQHSPRRAPDELWGPSTEKPPAGRSKKSLKFVNYAARISSAFITTVEDDDPR